MTTIVEVAKAARDLAHEQPTHIYRRPEDSQRCLYVQNDEQRNPTQGCIFGQAMIRVGIPVEEITKYEGLGIDVVLARLILRGVLERSPHDGTIEEEEGVIYEDVGVYIEGSPLLNAMKACQGRQDSTHPWGYAIDPVEKWFEAHPEVE